MFSRFTKTISQLLTNDPSLIISDKKFSDNALAISALLCEVSQADENISDIESESIIDILTKLFDIPKQEASALLEVGKSSIKDANSLFEFTTELENLSQEARISLIESMWEVAYADDHLDPVEEGIIRKVAKLLYVEHSQFIKAKLLVNKKR